MRLAAVAALLSLSSGIAEAQPRGRQVIERVVAVVNDDAIWLSELRRRAVPFLDRAMAAPSEAERQAAMEQLYGELLTHLIDEELIQQAARGMQVRVTAEDVQRAIQNVQRQSGLEDDEFWNAVRAQGFTERQYREDVRRQLLRLKVLNTRARGRVNITEDDVRQRYDQMVRQANTDACMEIDMLRVELADDASATEVAAARQRAEALKRELTPTNIRERGAIDLGQVCGGLQPQFQQVVAGLRPGQISDPVRAPGGFFIFHLRDVVRGGANVPGYEQVKNDLYRQMLEQAMARQEQIFIGELRREAVIQRRL